MLKIATMNLIIPAAGKSTRFPGMKPKWMLTHPNGNIMLTEAIRRFNTAKFKKIFLVILKDHVKKYNCLGGIVKAFDNIGIANKLEIIVLDKETKNQPETVALAIKKEKISGPIFIKDSDNQFECDINPMNGVVVFDLNKMSHVNRPANKSYVMLDDNGIINNIVEKQIISSSFCAGGYLFNSSDDFLNIFKELKDNEGLYISHIIYKMILNGSIFRPISASSYEDWGTLQDWNAYKNCFSTIFIDLDGTLLENAGEYFGLKWGEASAIKENVAIINELYESGRVKIIITTSRKGSYRRATIKQLKREGIKYHDVIFDLFHGKRIVVNDYANSNPYKSCDAINIKRNSNELREMIKDSLSQM
jgi:uncharacterized protein YjhX (UPF0386 family)